MRVLLSINPEFVAKIASGEKKYEFRKIEFKQEISEILVYETSPMSKVVGIFRRGVILSEAPEKIWELTKLHSGIEKDFFDSYYENRTKAVAIEIQDYQSFKVPKKLSEYGVKTAPQSFVYIN